MGHLIDLTYRYQRRRRPPKDALAPWTPGQGARRLLEYLVRYRYLTRELLALLVEHEHGRGAGEVRNHLTRLWRHGYVERFFRPTEYGQGSRQYVYTATGEGARRVLDPETWETARWRIRKLLKHRRDYEHPVAVALMHVLWDLGSRAEPMRQQFTTALYWQDREGEGTARNPVNRFEVRVDGRRVRLDPDSTALLGVHDPQPGYYRPLFVEIERTHKNRERLEARFRAYHELVGEQSAAADAVFGRALQKDGFHAERGSVLFVAGDRILRDQLRAVAHETVGFSAKRGPDFWFLALDDLFEASGDARSGARDGEERIIGPARLFAEPLALRIDGKRGMIVSPSTGGTL